MFVAKTERKWSDVGLGALAFSVVAVIFLAIVDGLIKRFTMNHAGGMTPDFVMFATWVLDFRYIFEQGVYAATVFFIGAKFLETRTLLTIGFDKLDGSRVVLKAPGDDNVVWIGHRYGTKLEADAVSATLAERLKESAKS